MPAVALVIDRASVFVPPPNDRLPIVRLPVLPPLIDTLIAELPLVESEPIAFE